MDNCNSKKIIVKTAAGEYPLILERGGLSKVAEYFDLQRKVLIVTDDGVPDQYVSTVMFQCKYSSIKVIPQGEQSKCMEILCEILSMLTKEGFTRTDCVVAIGGGAVGDIAGFASAIYMRGIDFYNIPTTLLAQVDSSVGGKTAIDFYGYKNIVGAFHQPKGVLIDAETIATLSPRQISNGMAEVIKMSLTSDIELFNFLENSRFCLVKEETVFKNTDCESDSRLLSNNAESVSFYDTIIERSLLIKKSVVETDENEAGIRKVLNFGHTIGHAIEKIESRRLLHGECVALGMIPMCSKEVRDRLIPLLKKYGLPTQMDIEKSTILEAITHDKKIANGSLTIIKVNKIGSYEMQDIPADKIDSLLDDSNEC